MLIVWTLLAVFVMAFAITSQAIIYEMPSEFGYGTLAEMIARAYWPMFGEYNMKEWDQGAHSIAASICCLGWCGITGLSLLVSIYDVYLLYLKS